LFVKDKLSWPELPRFLHGAVVGVPFGYDQYMIKGDDAISFHGAVVGLSGSGMRRGSTGESVGVAVSRSYAAVLPRFFHGCVVGVPGAFL
jgi:hypothetical protein